MWMIFDIKQHNLRHKARLVVGGHAVDSSEYITYSSTIKEISVRLMLMIEVENGLGLMAVDIRNYFCIEPCANNIWFTSGQ